MSAPFSAAPVMARATLGPLGWKTAFSAAGRGAAATAASTWSPHLGSSEAVAPVSGRVSVRASSSGTQTSAQTRSETAALSVTLSPTLAFPGAVSVIGSRTSSW